MQRWDSNPCLTVYETVLEPSPVTLLYGRDGGTRTPYNGVKVRCVAITLHPYVEAHVGLEPTTTRLTAVRSTFELMSHITPLPLSVGFNGVLKCPADIPVGAADAEPLLTGEACRKEVHMVESQSTWGFV